MDREDIHIISRHSNWSESGVDKALKDNVYSDSRSWERFLQLFFISLGIGFAVSGIIFFFAYNWADLNKFAKMGLVEGLIVLLICVILFSKLNLSIKNILLTGASVLVGVLMAVFGQIYQTGANAYDFFLGWTLFIGIWVIISNFLPLWLLYLLLINTTFVLYTQQFGTNWSEMFVLNVLFFFNAFVLVFLHVLPKFNKEYVVPSWFSSTVGLATVAFSTIGIIVGIFGTDQTSFLIMIGMTTIAYAFGIYYGLREKNGFYLSIIPFSVIVIISALLIKISSGGSMFFVVGLFIIVSVTLLIKGLLEIQKKWNNEG